jgi:hypothetical protein
MSNKSTGEELSDMFYALQITTKIMESITKEHDAGTRDQKDFETRWQGQSELLCRNLAKIKPLVETFIKAGYNKYHDPLNNTDNYTPSDTLEKFITTGYNKHVSSVSIDTKNHDDRSSDAICDTTQI